MVKFITESVGGYPRIGDGKGQQTLRRTIDLWEKGEKSDKDLLTVQDDLAGTVIREQVEAGIDLPTNGLIHWYDPVSHLLRKVKNVEVHGLLRFFDTNCYFRQPVLMGRPEWIESAVLDEFLHAKSVNASLEHPRFCVKVVLTGPLTLASLSICGGGYSDGGLASRTMMLADVLAREVEVLAKNGARIIQIDEPMLLRNPDAFGIFRPALQRIVDRRGEAMISLCTYFGDAAPLYAKFQELPVTAIHFDLIYGTTLIDRILSEGSARILGLGLVDGRNTKLEDPRSIARLASKVADKLQPKELLIHPSCGLEYLPRDRSFEKLAALNKARNLLALN